MRCCCSYYLVKNSMIFWFVVQMYNCILRIPDLLWWLFLHGELSTHSYDVMTAFCLAQYGNPEYCWQIVAWRALIHLVVCLVFIFVFRLLSKKWYRKLSFYLCVLLIVAVLIQEIVIHPLYYGQVWRKGVIDIVTWYVPLGVFLYKYYSKPNN